MAANRQLYNYSQNGGNANKSTNRVYINPYFHRISNVNTSGLLQHNVMHVNPNFSQNPITEHTSSHKTKIYVNPNFIKTNQVIQNSENTQAKYHTEVNSSSNILHNDILTKQSLPLPTIKNRYCLVRHKVNKGSNDPTPLKVSTTITLKVNKYKSVLMADFKKNIATLNNSNKIIKQSPYKIKQTSVNVQNAEKNKMHIDPSHSRTYRSKFKLIKRNTPTATSNIGFSIYKNLTLSRVSSGLKVSQQKRTNIIKRKFKKNNIPCSLFRKYGKCLRDTNGKCEFLHDKKHVSICRKFLKGMCHDKQCLLSHDVTHKKMPTCYFYLKGICNKDDCPYLHVKLNEKTKICKDFLKGYCEKGDECLNRHINFCPKKTIKGGSLKNQYQYCHTDNKTKVNKKDSQVPRHVLRVEKIKSKTDNDENISSSSRYYKEIINDDHANETDKIMKPTRCKLGTLPSFIQF